MGNEKMYSFLKYLGLIVWESSEGVRTKERRQQVFFFGRLLQNGCLEGLMKSCKENINSNFR